jgi:23S rRNA (cytosine1962-C5)-methyltransferase
MNEVFLKKGKEKAVLQRHPWVFSGAIERVKGKPENGEIVRLIDGKGSFLAYGFYNNQSRVAVRLLEWNEAFFIDENWWRSRIQTAVNNRKDVLNEQTNTCRLIFSEADFLPGLIVDKYADHLSVQILTSGMEKVKEVWIDELQKLLQPKSIFDRSDATSRSHEGLEASFGLLYGENPPDFVEVKENGIRYEVSISEGQKSGFYCDQRDNRRLVALHASGKKVLL